MRAQRAVWLLLLSTSLQAGGTARGADDADPATVLRAYFTALQAQDWPTLYDLLSQPSRDGQTLDEFTKQKSGPGSSLSAMINARSSYEILGTRVAEDGQRAAVDVRLKAPDLKHLFNPTGVPSAKTVEEAPLEERQQKIELVREDERWKVERLPPKLPPHARERLEKLKEAERKRAMERSSDGPTKEPE